MNEEQLLAVLWRKAGLRRGPRAVFLVAVATQAAFFKLPPPLLPSFLPSSLPSLLLSFSLFPHYLLNLSQKEPGIRSLFLLFNICI